MKRFFFLFLFLTFFSFNFIFANEVQLRENEKFNFKNDFNFFTQSNCFRDNYFLKQYNSDSNNIGKKSWLPFVIVGPSLAGSGFLLFLLPGIVCLAVGGYVVKLAPDPMDRDWNVATAKYYRTIYTILFACGGVLTFIGLGMIITGFVLLGVGISRRNRNKSNVSLFVNPKLNKTEFGLSMKL